MDAPILIPVAMMAGFIILGVILSMGKCSFLIAGYNMMSISSGQDLYSGITIFPINFPTEWLITVDSSAFFAENEKITVSQISIRNSQIIPALFLFLLFSVIFFPVFFLPVQSHAFDIIPAVISRILRLKICKQIFLIYTVCNQFCK